MINKNIEILRLLIKSSVHIREIFKGYYVLGNLEEEDTFYELHILTNEDYNLSLLIDDSWTYTDFLYPNQKVIRKVDFYLVHPLIDIISKHEIIEDRDLLYYLPFSKIEKHFLHLSDIPIDSIPQSIQKLLNGTSCHTLKVTEKQKPILSIITTVFNNAKLLEQTIQSVINQNNPEVEYVIKDAGSTDNFHKIISRYKDYIDIVISEPDKGIYYGMHHGFMVAHGEFLQPLNSDDILFPGVSLRYTNMMHTSHADMFTASIMRHKHGVCKILNPRMVLSQQMHVNHPATAIKKNVYLALGGFDLRYRCAADRNLLIKFLLHQYKYESIDVETVHFRVEGMSSKVEWFNVMETYWNIRLGYKYDIKSYLLLAKKTIRFFIIKIKNYVA